MDRHNFLLLVVVLIFDVILLELTEPVFDECADNNASSLLRENRA